MKKLGLLCLLAFVGAVTHARASVCTTINGSSGQSAVQSALNSCGSGNTLALTGTLTVTSPLTQPCGVSMTGPVVPLSVYTDSAGYKHMGYLPTAKIQGNLGANNLVKWAACTSPMSFSYIETDGEQPSGGGGGSLYIPGNQNHVTVFGNYMHGMQGHGTSGGSDIQHDSAIILDGSNPGNNTQNVSITWNIFGNYSSAAGSGDCNNLMHLTGPPYEGGSPDNAGGTCAGLGIHTGATNLVVTNNVAINVEQGMKMYEGSSGNFCASCNFSFNDFSEIHRIAFETQITPTGTAELVSYNSYHDYFLASYYSMFLSMANGLTAVTNGIGNLAIGNPAAGTAHTGWLAIGHELWGHLSTAQNEMFQGDWSAAIGANLDGHEIVTNNSFCGPGSKGQSSSARMIYVDQNSSLAAFMSLSGNTPSTANAVNASGQSTCSVTASTTPTISPAAGAQTFPITVSLTNPGTGVNTNTSIWYTTDGSTPVPMTGSTQLYSAPFTLNAATTVKAVGMWGKPNQPSTYPPGYGFAPSSVLTAVYGGSSAAAAATPVFSPGTSSFATSLGVSISDATIGATIYYTSDGSTPTTSSTAYTGPITVTGASTVVKAMAIKSGYSQSATATATYTSTSFVSTPTFAPASGTTFTSSVSVSISDITPSSTIYYTIDGSTPTTGSTVYSGPLTISAITTVKAIAAASGLTNSSVGSATYSLVGPTVTDTPTASPAAGSYFSTQSVTLSDTTVGASICYTTDGTTPAATTAGTCSHGTTYSTAISVSSSETINAIGTLSGKTNSPVAAFVYGISAPTPSQRGNIDYTQIKSLERLGPGNMFQMANKGVYGDVNTATPCNSTNQGATAFVTDSTTAAYAAAISGGGSNKVHALCNGSAWVVD
jgi:hypothetical protein